MPTAFEVLATDHEHVKLMLSEFAAGPTVGADAGERELALRKKMAEELIIAGSKHEAIEEMYCWPGVPERIPDGDRPADKAIGQEQEAKEVTRLDADNPDFEQLLGKFIKAAREHIAFAETQAWPSLRFGLIEQEATKLRKLPRLGEG
jgi:hypothetical protein